MDDASTPTVANSNTTTSMSSSSSSDLQQHLPSHHTQPVLHDVTSVRRASSAARALVLTREERDKLQHLTATLLHDVVAAYETHVHTNNRQAPASQWKIVKQRDHFAVAKQTHTQPRKRSWSFAASSSRDEMPTMMMAFGTIAGQLDDVLYGVSSETTREMKLQGSYSSGATLHDAAVLAVIEAPSLAQPFRFLGFKWTRQSFRLGAIGASSSSSSSALLRKRDLLYVEAMGMTTLSNGEPVGYRIQHSVDFKSMQHLSTPSSAVRAKISLCQLFRQREDGTTLDVFMRGYYDPSGGRVSQLLATTLATDLMLQICSDALECANLKKLAWCAKQSGRRRRTLTAWMAAMRRTTTTSSPSSSSRSSLCMLCDRECSGLLRRSASACVVCSQLVCARCSVSKKLSFTMGPALSSDVLSHESPSQQQEHPPEQDTDAVDEIRQKALSFCLHCVVVSNRERAFDVAVSDLVERGHGSGASAPDSRSSGRARPSSHTWQPRGTSDGGGSDDRYSQWLATPQTTTRRRATTASGKRLTTVLSFGGLTPSSTSSTGTAVTPGSRAENRGKAFSVASGSYSVTESSSGHDSEHAH